MTATSAVIPASGRGRRLGKEADKAFVPLAGKPLVARTLAAFQECRDIDEIVLVIREEEVNRASCVIRSGGFSKVTAVVAGGNVRQDSVRNGLMRVSDGTEIVVIHDGARPLVTDDIINESIEAARETGAAIAAVPVTDTIKSSQDASLVQATVEREHLYSIQTPQTFRRDVIETAYERAYAENYSGTDDASLVERLGMPVRLVPGSYENVKITTPSDLAFAEAVLRRREGVPTPGPTPRIGYGYDVHRFGAGRRLFVGGVEFPGEEGLLGHSDADVMLHAIMDTVLGAAAAGDIGRLFPDTDPAYRDIRSTMLLGRVAEAVAALGWRVSNLDATLVADRPRIAERVPEMRGVISETLGIGPEQVSVKASTSEGLGFVGEGLGIECHAVAVLVPL